MDCNDSRAGAPGQAIHDPTVMNRLCVAMGALLMVASLSASLALDGNVGNDHPIVLVHGWIGWGRDEMHGYLYWGVQEDIQAHLNANGHETHSAAVGPISSNWDRACELFAYIKGGRVDYGAAHSALHGHLRFGRPFRGLLRNWGALDESGDVQRGDWRLFPPARPLAATIGSCLEACMWRPDNPVPLDSTWFGNDGIVNTRAMRAPTLGSSDQVLPWDGATEPGRWQFMGVQQHWDHFDVVGLNELWPYPESSRPKNLNRFYEAVAELLHSLPR